ncbi:putative ribonuclease H-like domain-containing protein [Tanacetum coccineum]
MNKLVKGNLVRGLPSKLFENDQTCVACQKGKQHRASCKSKTENSISLPLHLLHMDLFGPTFVKSLMKKMYCLVVTDDYSRFTWVFFLATKDETSDILKSFITGIENLVDHKVKVIRCDNGTEFKNREMNQFCEMKGKFDGKVDEGFFVGYSLNSKAFRVFNSRTRIVEENLHIKFSESTPNVVGSGPDWLFDIDALTRTMNYEPIVADYILLPLWTADPPYSQDPKSSHDDGSKPSSDDGKKVDEDPRKESECNDQEKEDNVNSTNNVNAAGTNKVNVVGGKTSIELPFDPNMPALEDYSIFDFSRDDEDDGVVADMNNLDTTIQVSPIPTTRIHKDHPLDQEEPKKVIHALKDPSWIEAMQEELLQFKLQEVWTLVDLPNGKRAIGSKWVFRNKKDERGIMIRNKARLESGARDEYYLNKVLINYEVGHGMQFTLCHCWEVLKCSPKWNDTKVPKFLSNPQASKRYNTSRSSSFNTESGDASINLNVDVGNDEEDECKNFDDQWAGTKPKLAMHNERVIGIKKEQRLAFLKIKMRDVECRERELAMQEYRQRQEDIMFYMQPYDNLTGDALAHMEAPRAEIKARWNLPY